MNLNMGKKKSGSGANSKLCEMLYILADYEKLVAAKTYKANAYRQAAELLASLPYKIKSGEEAKKLGKIGNSIAEKIDQFLSTGKIAKVEEVKRDKDFQAILRLTQVPGIGPSKARELIKKGVKTIEDLATVQDSLNHHQLVGLKYFSDFQLKIPRGEIEAIERVLIEELAQIDSQFIVTICGSYRRGKSSSGDVDCLITHPKYTSANPKGDNAPDVSLKKIVNQLKCAELIADTIALGQTKFMGVCQLNAKKPARRLDIRLIPSDQYYCAILYFTGSDIFNRNMRAHALSKGFSLNEYALRPIGSSGKLGDPVPLKSERQIFQILDYPYKPPNQRDF